MRLILNTILFCLMLWALAITGFFALGLWQTLRQWGIL